MEPAPRGVMLLPPPQPLMLSSEKRGQSNLESVVVVAEGVWVVRVAPADVERDQEQFSAVVRACYHCRNRATMVQVQLRARGSCAVCRARCLTQRQLYNRTKPGIPCGLSRDHNTQPSMVRTTEQRSCLGDFCPRCSRNSFPEWCSCLQRLYCLQPSPFDPRRLTTPMQGFALLSICFLV